MIDSARGSVDVIDEVASGSVYGDDPCTAGQPPAAPHITHRWPQMEPTTSNFGSQRRWCPSVRDWPAHHQRAVHNVGRWPARNAATGPLKRGRRQTVNN